MQIPLHQVDAFAERVFTGNPAAVCPLEAWLPDPVLQAIAGENNLSETAFLVRNGDDWDLRWFTPAVEVDLCGHATLAGGWLVLERLEPGRDHVHFHTRSGRLTVARRGQLLGLDLPAHPPVPVTLDAGYLTALGGTPRATLRGAYTMAVFDRERELRELAPDMASLAVAEPLAVSVSAPADDPELDFVSRFFAPSIGIPEDPVTGSAHSSLVPYWSERLGRTTLEARQVSARGGALKCELADDRVRVSGRVVPYLEGTITIEDRT